MQITRRKNRKDEILELLLESGRVDVKELARRFDMSEATVRRDLRALAARGQLALVYGGAELPGNGHLTFDSRALRNVEAKRSIGRLAGQLVADHEMLYVDGGTTCFEMRHLLKMRRGLKVFVNSWRFAVELASAGAQVVQIGGSYRPEREDCVGTFAEQTMDQIRGYTAYISADGLDLEVGLWSNDDDTAGLYQHVINNARSVILLVDHTKFENSSLYKICSWDPVKEVVTDKLPEQKWQHFLRSRGIRLVCPESSDADE